MAAHAVTYQITGPIPDTWHTWIRNAAAAWTNVSTSSFWFREVASSPNQIVLSDPGVDGPIAQVRKRSYDSETLFAPIIMEFNRQKGHGPPPSWDYDPQTTATLEFGHFLRLIETNFLADVCRWETM